MKRVKKILSIFCLAAVLTSGAITASAATPAETPASPAAVINPVSPCSDEIETIYRATTDGRVQYRRWNATRGYWVDPYWITLP